MPECTHQLSPTDSLFMSCSRRGIEVFANRSRTPSVIITTREEWNAAFSAFSEGLKNVLCSSSMDFPEEYTNDPEILELCRLLQ